MYITQNWEGILIQLSKFVQTKATTLQTFVSTKVLT